MYKFDLEAAREKILLASDPNSGYTQADFDKEFNVAKISSNNDFYASVDYYKYKLKFINKSNNADPEYATNGASGFDLKASLENTLIIKKGERALVSTGLYFEIPDNFEIQVRPRSGLAAKNGVTVLNTPGTIDSDYRGEVKVILINHGDIDFTIVNGDRIAQAVFAPVLAKNLVSLVKVNEISENTERGAGGFGSTGTK